MAEGAGLGFHVPWGTFLQSLLISVLQARFTGNLKSMSSAKRTS